MLLVLNDLFYYWLSDKRIYMSKSDPLCTIYNIVLKPVIIG